MKIKLSRKFFVIILVIALVLVISASLANTESAFVKQTRFSTVCFFAMSRIGVALQEYAENHGNNIHFPPTLQTLIEHKYLKNPDIFYCGSHTPKTAYRYFGNLRKDMPSQFPVLVESETPHIYHSQQGEIKYGRVLLLDFSLTFVRESEVPILIKDTEEALEISKIEDRQILSDILKKSKKNSLAYETALWKLRQIKY